MEILADDGEQDQCLGFAMTNDASQHQICIAWICSAHVTVRIAYIFNPLKDRWYNSFC